jgi:hypothetical protein
MAKNLLHCETGFGVYRSTQLGHIRFFLLLYLLVGPSIMRNLVNIYFIYFFNLFIFDFLFAHTNLFDLSYVHQTSCKM